MLNFSKKLSLYAGMLAGFVVTLQAFQGTFKTFWPGKQVRISKSSQKFLQNVVPMQQELFASLSTQGIGLSAQFHQQMLALLQLSRSWMHAENMQGTDIDRFGQLITGVKQTELLVKNRKVDERAIVTLKSLIQSIAHVVADEIKQVHIGTAQVDLQQIGQFLQLLQDHVWDLSFRAKALGVFGIAQDIMHHFDGVSVTEYDFIVLSQCIIFMQLLSCMS